MSDTAARDVIAKTICCPRGCTAPEGYRCEATFHEERANAILSALLAAPESVRLDLAQRLNPWRPIEMAPKDGTWFLAVSNSGNWRRISWGKNKFGEQCWCSVDFWWTESEKEFVRWLSLPAPPASEE